MKVKARIEELKVMIKAKRQSSVSRRLELMEQDELRRLDGDGELQWRWSIDTGMIGADPNVMDSDVVPVGSWFVSRQEAVDYASAMGGAGRCFLSVFLVVDNCGLVEDGRRWVFDERMGCDCDAKNALAAQDPQAAVLITHGCSICDAEFAEWLDRQDSAKVNGLQRYKLQGGLK